MHAHARTSRKRARSRQIAANRARAGFEKRMFPFAPDVRLILWGVDLSGHFQRFGPFLVFLRAH